MPKNQYPARLGLIAAGLLLLSLATAAPAQEPKYRAFWADAFSQGFKSTSQITSMVSRAQAGHYNVIFAEVMAYQDNVGTGHGAYWNSTIVPKATDIVGGIDPLAVLVAQAHAVGIEVHAWIVPFRTCTTWPPSGNSTLTAHPEWLTVTQANMGGGPSKVDGKYMLDPGSPDVQQYLTNIIQELVTNYAIDGVNFDYIRYTQSDAGYPSSIAYTKSSLVRFQNWTGYVGVPAPTGVTSWNDFRRQTINELVRRTRPEVAAITANPRQPVAFSADLICSGDAPSNFAYSDAYALFQNWRLWLEEGWLDLGVPMNYKREWDSPQDVWYRNWIDAAVAWRYDRHVACGQANYLNPKADSVTQLAYALSAGANGTSNYSYDATADENMNGSSETDWTWYTYVAANLFTTTVATPTMPWRDPNTAVEGTLWGRCTDFATGTPIEQATVTVGALGSVQTDGNGYFVFTLLPANPGGTSYNIAASKNGCPIVNINGVAIYPGELTWQAINLCPTWGGVGDMDEDGDIDWTDFNYFAFCLHGPDYAYAPGNFCLNGDANGDFDMDLPDFANFQRQFPQP